MRTKSILLFLAVGSLLLLGLSWPVAPAPTIIHFSEGTTLEQAALALEPFELDLERGYRWSHPNDVTTWSGGIHYAPNQDDIAQIRSAHWEKYYRLILSDLANVEKVTNQRRTAESTPQYEALLQEKTSLDETILNCWDNDSCPSVPVDQTDVEADISNIADELTALAVVERIQRPESSNGFFYLSRLAFQ